MRNKIIALILTVFLVFCLAGCGVDTGSKDYSKNTSGRLQSTGMQDLYYDTNTKIVYILFNEWANGYMSPYYAPNGRPYVYNVETNSIEEIVTED